MPPRERRTFSGRAPGKAAVLPPGSPPRPARRSEASRPCHGHGAAAAEATGEWLNAQSVLENKVACATRRGCRHLTYRRRRLRLAGQLKLRRELGSVAFHQPPALWNQSYLSSS